MIVYNILSSTNFSDGDNARIIGSFVTKAEAVTKLHECVEIQFGDIFRDAGTNIEDTFDEVDAWDYDNDGVYYQFTIEETYL